MATWSLRVNVQGLGFRLHSAFSGARSQCKESSHQDLVSSNLSSTRVQVNIVPQRAQPLNSGIWLKLYRAPYYDLGYIP